MYQVNYDDKEGIVYFMNTCAIVGETGNTVLLQQIPGAGIVTSYMADRIRIIAKNAGWKIFLFVKREQNNFACMEC